jgi:hypothetical protein
MQWDSITCIHLLKKFFCDCVCTYFIQCVRSTTIILHDSSDHSMSVQTSSFSAVPSVRHRDRWRRHCFELQSTDHELIPARNASLTVMQCSTSGSNAHYYPTLKHLSLKERMNKAWTWSMFAVRLWTTTSSYCWPIGSLPSTCIPPQCTRDVYIPQGSNLDPWTVLLLSRLREWAHKTFFFNIPWFHDFSKVSRI